MTLTEESRLADLGGPGSPAGGHAPGSAFLLCAEPGSGAELLTAALRERGVVVHALPPDTPAEPDRVAGWLAGVLAAPADGAVGVGATLGWQHFAPLVRRPRQRPKRAGGRRREPWTTALTTAAPELRYVHLLRRAAPPGDGARPQRSLHWYWIGFFTWARLTPRTLAYEDVVSDPAAAAGAVLSDLGLPAAEPTPQPERTASPAPPATPAAGGRRRAAAHRTRAAVSIVVVSHNEGENLPLTIAGIRATVPDDVEVVVVDDQSTDGSPALLRGGDARVVTTTERGGVTGARNAGARAATGDVLVFADAHVDPDPGWLEPLVAALGDPGVGCAAPVITEMNHRQSRGYGFTWNAPGMRMHWLRGPRHDVHEVPFACGCLMAFRRDDFEAVGGFDAGLVRWGSEDAEIGLNLWRRGRATVVVPASQVAHLFRPSGPYEVAGHYVVHNTLRVATTHLPDSALTRVVENTRQYGAFPLAYANLVDSDVWARRDDVARHARHDGEWFLDRFRIDAFG